MAFSAARVSTSSGEKPQAFRFARCGRRRRGGAELHAGGRTAEARGGAGLQDAVDLHEAAAGLVVEMAGSLAEAEHGGEANIGVFHDLAPLVAGLLPEEIFEAACEWRASRTCRTGRGATWGRCRAFPARARRTSAPRRRWTRACRPWSVAAPEGGAAVEGGWLRPLHPLANRGEAEAGEREIGGTLRHGDVDDLALDRRRCASSSVGQQTGEQEHGAAAHVADHIERRNRMRARADGVQDAGERDVVDVVAGGLGERPVRPQPVMRP